MKIEVAAPESVPFTFNTEISAAKRMIQDEENIKFTLTM